MASFKVLLTGATGYIGGSVLSALLKNQDSILSKLQITALVRKDDQASVLRARGVNAIVFAGLEDNGFLQNVAADHDMAINTASTFHTAAAVALIRGLGVRRAKTQKPVWFIHASGTGSIADLPVSGRMTESRVFSDFDGDIYEYLQQRESTNRFAQRTTDVKVVQAGLEFDVKTYIIMSPMIYGLGSGLFNRQSIQIPAFIRQSIRSKQPVVIAEGQARWSNIHIDDLAGLYEFLLAQLLADKDLPTGEQGFYFSENGENSWLDVSKAIAVVGHDKGLWQTKEPQSLSLQRAADEMTHGNATLVELGFASNSRSKSDLARKFGWIARRGEKEFQASFTPEFEAVLAETDTADRMFEKSALMRNKA